MIWRRTLGNQEYFLHKQSANICDLHILSIVEFLHYTWHAYIVVPLDVDEAKRDI